MKRKLTGISDIRRFFHRNERPIFFISSTNFNLMGIDEWVKNFHYISYVDCYDGAHPNVFVPSEIEHAEFESIEDIDRFYELVTRYAKKDSPDEPGLIYDAWWQPFYRTFQPSSFGKELTVQLVSFQGYRTNLMSLPKDAEEKLQKLRAMHADWSVEPISIWVNPAFYRFQLGDYR